MPKFKKNPSTKTPIYKKSSGFKMKGSPHKTGVIEGTSAYGSALKHAQSVGQGGTEMMSEEEKIRNQLGPQSRSLIAPVAGAVSGFGF